MSGSVDKTVKVWDVNSGLCVFSGPHLTKQWLEHFDFFDSSESLMGTIGLSGDGGILMPRLCVCPIDEDILCIIDDNKLHCVRRIGRSTLKRHTARSVYSVVVENACLEQEKPTVENACVEQEKPKGCCLII